MFFISVRDEFNISSFNDSRPRSCRQLMRFSPLVNTIGNFLDALTLISVKLNDTGRCWVAININYNSTGSWLISSSTYHRTTREDRRETNVVNRSVDYSRHAYVSKLNTGPGLFRSLVYCSALARGFPHDSKVPGHCQRSSEFRRADVCEEIRRCVKALDLCRQIQKIRVLVRLSGENGNALSIRALLSSIFTSM